MEHVMMAVYDAKAAAFLPPFFVRTREMGERMFVATCRDEASDFSRFPEDYTLFELGAWGDKESSFLIHPAPVSVVTAYSLMPAIRKARDAAPALSRFEEAMRSN